MTIWNRINESDRRRHARIASGSQGINITIGDTPSYKKEVLVKTNEKEWVEKIDDYDFVYIKRPPKTRTLD